MRVLGRLAVLALALLGAGFSTLVHADAGATALAPQSDLHGRFTQTKTVQGLSKPLLSRGTFALRPGRGLVWRTLSPLRGTVVVTAKGVFTLDAAGARRQASGAEALALMNEVLAGDAQALGRSFEVRRETASKGWSLSLTPKPGPLASVFKRIEAQGTGFARRARLVESSGDETLLRFEGVSPGSGPLAPAEEALLGP